MAGSLESRGRYKKIRPYKGKKPGWRNPKDIPRTEDGDFAPSSRSTPPNKVCYECKIDKPIGEYYKYKKMADGHLNICKACMKARIKTRRKESKELRKTSGDYIPEFVKPQTEEWVPLKDLKSKPQRKWWES